MNETISRNRERLEAWNSRATWKMLPRMSSPGEGLFPGGSLFSPILNHQKYGEVIWLIMKSRCLVSHQGMHVLRLHATRLDSLWLLCIFAFLQSYRRQRSRRDFVSAFLLPYLISNPAKHARFREICRALFRERKLRSRRDAAWRCAPRPTTSPTSFCEHLWLVPCLQRIFKF